MKRIAHILAVGFTITNLSCVYAQSPHPARVVTQNVFEKEIAKTTPIVGILDFNRISAVSSEESGLIIKHYFEEGDSVEKGEPLVEFDTDFIRKDIEITRKEIDQIEIQIEEAEKNVSRLEQLFKSSATSEKSFDEEYFAHKKLLKRKEQLGKELERLNLKLEKSTVRAPFSGIILAKYKELGEWVSNVSPVCEIASKDDVIARVGVSEDLIKYIDIGDMIMVSVNPLGKEFQGSIDSFVPVADLKSKTFWLKIRIPYFEKAIQNMSITALIPSSAKMKITMIRRDALVAFNGQNFIYSVNENAAVIIPVNIVVYDGLYVGVESPLIAVGMPVVIDGNNRLQPGQLVEVIEEKQ
ncbi:MAG: efflux RND transporter periplasmic adaptor subunit [Candidatus Auribacterota bacterium]|jgi:RND family efflux transporter MFP subunit|nr:efflux RND transporter periplasmic adaptor subunit [Candidatus Auribacterota bacterium]